MSKKLPQLLGFNSYVVVARLRPGLVTAMPFGLSLTPWLSQGDYKLLTGLLGPIAVGGLGFFVLADIAREAGKKIEPDLYTLWGGMPSVKMLRHSDQRLSMQSKSQIHDLLSKLLGKPLPTASEEAQDPGAADDCYRTASEFLVSHTRDEKTFELVQYDLRRYGFRRNLLGLKPFGVTGCLLAIASAVTHLIVVRDPTTIVPSALVAGIAILIGIYWIFIVRAPYAKSAADSYAKQLLMAALLLKAPKAPATTKGTKHSKKED